MARPYATKETEIAVQTRSVIGAMRWLSHYVLVPPKHLTDGYAVRIPEMRWLYNYVGMPAQHGADGRTDKATKLVGEPNEPPLVIDSDLKKPRDPFVAIPYQGYWFSISKEDSSNSKFALIYLRTLLALADTGPRPTTPVLTIPTR